MYSIMLTGGECKGAEVSEEVARPLSLVLSQALSGLLPDGGGQVRVGLGGQSLAGLGRCRSEQQTQDLGALVSMVGEEGGRREKWAMGGFKRIR